MVMTRISRTMPGVRGLLRVARSTARHPPHLPMAPACARCMSRGPYGGSDPFLQMETFMKDMERKFKRNVEDTLSAISKEIPPGVLPRAFNVDPPQPRFGDVKDVSNEVTYKLAFHFPQAKPEDISVALKGTSLTVTASKETVTETSRSSQTFSFEYDLPEGLELNALESSLTDDGILIIEAPQPITENKTQGPQPIDIKRE